jgi:nitroreductase
MLFSVRIANAPLAWRGSPNYRRSPGPRQTCRSGTGATRIVRRQAIWRRSLLEVIRKRRSIRSYRREEVEEDRLQEVLKAAMFAPSSRGRRAWEFVVVKSEEVRNALSEASPYSFFVKDAPVAIVVCYDADAGRRFKEDASICAEHIHLEAVNPGLASCFVQIAEAEGSHGDAEEYVKRLLGVTNRYRIQCIMPIGYPADELPEHSDTEFDESKIHHERFQP